MNVFMSLIFYMWELLGTGRQLFSFCTTEQTLWKKYNDYRQFNVEGETARDLLVKPPTVCLNCVVEFKKKKNSDIYNQNFIDINLFRK